jgi:hypothetical protein
VQCFSRCRLAPTLAEHCARHRAKAVGCHDLLGVTQGAQRRADGVLAHAAVVRSDAGEDVLSVAGRALKSPARCRPLALPVERDDFGFPGQTRPISRPVVTGGRRVFWTAWYFDMVPGPESNSRPQGASVLDFGEILNKKYRFVYRQKLMCTRFGSRCLGNYSLPVFFSGPATIFATLFEATRLDLALSRTNSHSPSTIQWTAGGVGNFKQGHHAGSGGTPLPNSGLQCDDSPVLCPMSRPCKSRG